METFLLIASSPVVSPIVRPFSARSKLIVAPSLASASAWRNEPGPLSFVLVTIVVGVAVGVGVAQGGKV